MVAVYEDFESGLRLIEFVKRLKFRIDNEFVINTSLWKFEMLEIPQIRSASAREAAAADLILVAMDNHVPLRVEVRDWLSGWVPERHGRVGALVATFGVNAHCGAADAVVETTLRDAATEAELQFLIVDSLESEIAAEELCAVLVKQSRGAVHS